jgi:cytochrome c553
MNRVLRWILIALGGVVGVAALAVGVLYVISGQRLASKHDAPAEQALVIPSDSASIARGARLVAAMPCGQCHGPDLGGNVFADAGPFALLAGPNLTRGRGGRTPPLTDVEWERAIRHGMRRDSTGLIVMPSEILHAIADDEMAPMIAYLKQMPSVDRDVPPTKLRIIGRIVLGLGQLKTAPALTPRTPHVATVDTTPGVEYGRYLASIGGCRVCHGESLSGGPGPDTQAPPASNITPTGIGHYTQENFIRALRTGQRPNGGAAINEAMPWKYYGTMSDGALQSLWLYLRTVPAKEFGAS